MADVKPLTLYTAASGPNSWKVAIVLKELGIPYKIHDTDYSKLHEKPYTDVNPNGRAPALHDPNTNITIWESNAINEYLIDKYDTAHKISHGSEPEKYLEKQYNFYQASGQGPYFGQAAWFNNYHPESLPSAKERYTNEIKRVVAVLDGILANRNHLVGNKTTYADLAYVMYNNFIDACMAPGTWKIDEYPNFKRWHEEMMARDSVKAAIAEREATMKAGPT